MNAINDIPPEVITALAFLALALGTYFLVTNDHTPPPPHP